MKRSIFRMMLVIFRILMLGTSTTTAMFPETLISDFIDLQQRPASVVSLLTASKVKHLALARGLKKNTLRIKTTYSADLILEDHCVLVADLQDNLTTRFLQEVEKQNQLITPSRWMLFIKDNVQMESYDALNNNDEIILNAEKYLEGVNIGLNTDVYIIITNINNKNYGIYSVYRRHPKSRLTWNLYSTWRQGSGMILSESGYLSLAFRRKDVAGHTVTISSVIINNESLSQLENYQQRQVDTFTKYTYYMTKHIVEFINGSYVLNITDSWGYKQPDGTFNGIIRELQEGRADMGGTPFLPNKERLSIVDFVVPPSSMQALFIFKKPSLASVTNIFVLPFSKEVWACVMILIALCAIASFVASYREQQYNVKKQDNTVVNRVSNSIVDTFSVVLQQGTFTDPKAISSRQILLMGLMVFMFLFTSYSANVVALLQSTTNDIKDVKDLLRSPLKLGLLDVVYNKYVFPLDTRPWHQALYRQKLLPQGDKMFSTLEDGIRRVQEGMFAFHVDQTAGYDEIQRIFRDNEKCVLGEVVFIATPSPYLGVSRNSPLKEILKIGARRIMESGIQSRSARRTVSVRPTCGANTAMFTAVELSHVAPALRMLLVAVGVAAALLVAEIIVHSCFRGQENINMFNIKI